MSKVKRYLIICLKRSEVFDNNTYWRPMRSGYTKDKMEAGYYRAEDLDDCAGSEGDWVAMPVWISTEKLIGQIMIMDENGRYFR